MIPDRGTHNRTALSCLSTNEFLAIGERATDKPPLLVEALERLHELHERDIAREDRWQRDGYRSDEP